MRLLPILPPGATNCAAGRPLSSPPPGGGTAHCCRLLYCRPLPARRRSSSTYESFTPNPPLPPTRLAWAYAKVGRRDDKLFDQLAGATTVLLAPYMKRYEAASGRGGEAAAAAISSFTSAAPAPLDAVAVTNLAWAYSHLRAAARHPELMAALAAVAAPYKGLYDNDQLASLARSYAAAGHYDADLCAALSVVGGWWVGWGYMH